MCVPGLSLQPREAMRAALCPGLTCLDCVWGSLPSGSQLAPASKEASSGRDAESKGPWVGSVLTQDPGSS